MGEQKGKIKYFGNYPLTVGTPIDDTRIKLSLISGVDIRMYPGGECEIIRREPEVRVPDEVLKSVAFIGETASGVYGDLLATGFFVSIPARTLPRRFLFFVTAKHVAKDLADKTAYIAVNKKGGGITALTTIGDQWWTHPNDQAVDVAVVECNAQPDQDLRAIPVERFIAPEMLGDTVGVGDETFITGLFTPAPGATQNVPIVRHGNIAMVPREPIKTELGLATVVLVEARSIGGLSGSPVFVRETISIPLQVEEGEPPMYLAGVSSKMHLLGLMHGHWSIKESERNAPAVDQDEEGVNMGIGIVVPAFKILETLNHPRIIEMLTGVEARASKAKGIVPGMDRAKKRKDEAGEFTRADFETALRKVSRKIDPNK